jgi:hypothetical protein
LRLAADGVIGVFKSWTEGDKRDRGDAAGDNNAAVAFLFCARLGEMGLRDVDIGGLSSEASVLDLWERNRFRVREVERASKSNIAISVSAIS